MVNLIEFPALNANKLNHIQYVAKQMFLPIIDYTKEQDEFRN